MELTDVIRTRRAVKTYDSSRAISDAELRSLFETMQLCPSSFNLQHARFVVIRDPQRKIALRKAAFDQQQVQNASATIVVVGYLGAHRDAERIYSDAPPDVRERMIPMIREFYEGKPQLQRDEAIRSASLAAMTLMYLACDAGFATGPMIGFDPDQVSQVAGLDADHIPVMLMVMGKQAGAIRPRPTRLPLGDVVRLDSLDGAGLG
jgi:nitroreductase